MKTKKVSKIKPLYDRILVLRSDELAQTKGGIFIPPTAQEKPMEGKVVAVGKGKIMSDGSVRPMDLNPGDKVLFGKYVGTEVVIDDVQHIIMREEDILAVLAE